MNSLGTLSCLVKYLLLLVPRLQGAHAAHLLSWQPPHRLTVRYENLNLRGFTGSDGRYQAIYRAPTHLLTLCIL